MPSDYLSSNVKLLLAVSEAAGINLGPTYRIALWPMAERTEPPLSSCGTPIGVGIYRQGSPSLLQFMYSHEGP